MPAPVALPLPRVVALAGPTASGKSALALDLARRFGATIVNADSMQVYRDLAILTARPEPAEMAAVPHRLYGTIDGAELCSAARWAALAAAEIETAAAAGRLPILVGGTGLYLRALLDGIAAVPEIPPEIRAATRTLHAELGGAAFHARLALRDPASAAQLHPADSQRLMRAYEVAWATGRPLGEWQRQGQGDRPRYQALRLAVLPDRAQLYDACNRRFLGMMARGALDEVAALRSRGLEPDRPVLKALGVPELMRHLEDEIGLDQAIALAQAATRHYAKRQITWFRHQFADAQLVDPANPDAAGTLVANWMQGRTGGPQPAW